MNTILKLMLALIFCISTSGVFAGQIWIPPKINGKKGDVVLSHGNEGDMIQDIVAMMGMYWNHTGLLIDEGENIRHNIMYPDEIPQDKSGCGVPYRLNPDGLSNGLPGIITEDVDTTYNAETHTGFNLAGGAIISPNDSNESSYRGFLELVADKMMFLRSYYRLNAYVSHWQMEDLDSLSSGVGNHCSGTIWFANYYSGKTLNIGSMSSSVVQACSESLYDSVKNMVNDEIGWAKAFAGDLADDVANQVVNTMVLNRPEDLTDYWRTNIDGMTANAVAPDMLLLSNFTNPAGNRSGIQDQGTSYYEKVTPLEWSDGYYIDDGLGDDDDDDDPPSNGCG